MRRCAGTIRKVGASALFVCCLVLAFADAALAVPAPQGAMACAKKLKETPGGQASETKYNLSYVPLLMDIARIFGRYQTHPGFFILNEPFSRVPGIDLQSLLFRQSSPLSIPDGLSAPADGQPPREADGPYLSIPTIRDKAEPPDAARRPNLFPPLAARPIGEPLNPGTVSSPPKTVASPDDINLSVQGNQINSPPPVLLVDFQGLSAALTGIGDTGSQIAKAGQERPLLVSTFAPAPLPHIPRRATNTAFMLWTARPGADAGADGAKGLAESGPYRGSFVTCAPAVRFKSIQGRRFVLEKGRLVGSNRGDDIIILTARGEVAIKSEASALVEMSESGIMRVLALESSQPASVTVTASADGGPAATSYLNPGEEMIVSPADITEADIQGGDGVDRKLLLRNARVARTSVALTDLLRKEPLLNQGPAGLSGPQQSAVSQLRERIAPAGAVNQEQ